MGSRLKGQVAIVTGGGSGMGEGQARVFASEGAAVIVADVREENCKLVAEDLEASGLDASYYQLDVRDQQNWRDLVSEAIHRHGKLDILCNNAGMNFRTDFHSQTYEQYRQIIDVNLDGVYKGCKAVGEAMRQSGGGAILNIGSLASTKHGGGTGYTVSKTGIIALTKNVALAYAADKIRCNAVCPGHVDTPFIRDDREHSPNNWETTIDNPDNYQRRLDTIPLGRFQTPDDVAKAALFLCGEEASMITGAVLNVDGGTSLV